MQLPTFSPSSNNRDADSALEPTRAQLADLEQQIRDREAMIMALRAKTFENDARIQVRVAEGLTKTQIKRRFTLPQRLLSGNASM